MDIITLASNVLIALTLVYCIILERRIRQFRQQEAIFKELIADLSRSTMAAQAATSDLRRALNDAEQQNPTTKSLPQPLTASRITDHVRGSSALNTSRLPVSMTAAEMARYFAELRLTGAR